MKWAYCRIVRTASKPSFGGLVPLGAFAHNGWMTDILLIRHGETDWNRQRRFQGHSDTRLNSTGEEQAQRLAQALSGEPISHVVSSDLTRTRQTAAPWLERQTGMALQSSSQWREQAFGELEGLPLADFASRYPEQWAQWLRHDPDFCLPGRAESRRQFHERAIRALLAQAAEHARLQQTHPQSTGLLVVFTHGGVLDMIYRTATGEGLNGPRTALIPNTGINRVRVDDGRIEILSWADQRHLEGMPEQPSTAQQAAMPER